MSERVLWLPAARPHWRCRANFWRGRTSPAAQLRRLTVRMSNILKPIDLTDHAIRRAVFAILDGLAHVVPARLQRMQERDHAKREGNGGPNETVVST
jgi:hypothetical protein